MGENDLYQEEVDENVFRKEREIGDVVEIEKSSINGERKEGRWAAMAHSFIR